MPGAWDDQGIKWSQVSEDVFASGRLFDSLRDIVEQRADGASRELEELEAGLKSWAGFMFRQPGEHRLRRQWYLARAMVWCAQRALACHPQQWNQQDRNLAALADLPAFFARRKDWALDCIRCLADRREPAGAPAAARTGSVPAAVTTDPLNRAAAVATLQLSLVEPGGGTMCLHPQDTLRTEADASFHNALRRAWEAAKDQARGEAVSPLFDARWRILSEGEPLRRVCGRSASGAAAVAWYRLLRGQLPDRTMLVLAEVDPEGRLAEVGGVEAKVAAAAAMPAGRIDTIVVASPRNYEEAKRALLASNPLQAHGGTCVVHTSLPIGRVKLVLL